VKRPASIENFGSMDILCCDKTGTLTEGTVHVHSAIDLAGRESRRVLEYAWLNATFESGFINPIDEAIRSAEGFDARDFSKLDEIPYDFLRKRLSVFVRHGNRRLLITKGAVASVWSVCGGADATEGNAPPRAEAGAQIDRLLREECGQGHRALGVAFKELSRA